MSAIALLLNYRTRRDVSAAKRSAQLRVEIRKEPNGTHRLYFVNTGMAEAYNIQLLLGGKPIFKEQQGIIVGELPPRVGPGSEASCMVVLAGYSRTLDAEVLWDDNYQKNRVYRTTLTY